MTLARRDAGAVRGAARARRPRAADAHRPGELLVCESGTNPSRFVGRTVELRLVSRTTPEAGDRRQVILQLTAKGRSLEEQVRTIEEAMYAGLDGIGTDAELATVIAVLERMVAGHPSGDAIVARVARGN